jgi:hypothetical protein
MITVYTYWCMTCRSVNRAGLEKEKTLTSSSQNVSRIDEAVISSGTVIVLAYQ